MAEGQSNPDVAAALFLSRNTVQTHVSHILAKARRPVPCRDHRRGHAASGDTVYRQRVTLGVLP